MEKFLLIFIGVGVGIVISLIVQTVLEYRKTVDGLLIIDVTDPEKDRYKFCIDDLDNLENKKTLILHVKKGAVDWDE